MEKHSIRAYLEYVGATVPSGNGWRKMKCPFHDDTHASAGVNEEKCYFKCFGCDVSGDVYNLIIHKEGGDYREAVKFAETISPTGSDRIRFANKKGRGLSGKSRSIGRRSAAVSSGSSEFSITKSRKLR